MRPASIIYFERFFWASMLVGVIGTFFFSWSKMEETLIASGSPFGMTVVVIWILAFATISVGLWYGIARRRSNVVRWIYAIWMGLGVVSTALSLLDPQTQFDVTLTFTLISTVLTAASIVCLFRNDAAAWLKGIPATDSSIFE